MKLPTLRTLLCHRDVHLALYCIKSVSRFSKEKFSLVIHEDGSLTDHDFYLLHQAFPGVRFISRKYADSQMDDILANHPNTRAFRQGSVWGLKLLDVVLLEPGICFYLDSDIAFFRPFKDLFVEKNIKNRFIFLKDTVWHSYSVRPWHLLDQRKLTLSAGINTGLTFCDRNVFDLDFVEWFLSHSDWRVIPAWTEPTCWAALASRVNSLVVNPHQIVNLYPSANITENFLGGHFLSSYRSRWQHLFNTQLNQNETSAESIEYMQLHNLHPFSFALNIAKRKLQNSYFLK